jgi:hypothetical protein
MLQSIVIFRTWVPPVGYTSRESLNRHYFLVCNDVLQHLHPLRPEDRENRVTPPVTMTTGVSLSAVATSSAEKRGKNA